MKPLLYTYLVVATLFFLLGTPICRSTYSMSTSECAIASAGAGVMWPVLVFKIIKQRVR